MALQRIAINTGGGDAPGLNAVIYSAVLTAHDLGLEIYGIREGYDGLLDPDRFEDGGLIQLTPERVEGISHLGGTMLGTVNKANPFSRLVRGADGVEREVDRSEEVLSAFRERQLEALIAVGGDGSLNIAHRLSLKGLPVIGVPKTIDNDLEGTSVTFGFDSAISFATEAIDRLHCTAEAHRRVMVVEVMGRHAGWIALYAGVAGRADAILIPEIPYDIELVAEAIRDRPERKRKYAIVVVAEGAKPIGGDVSILERPLGREVRLGGIGEVVARELEQRSGKESRSVVLGHLLRGGSPTATDRMLGLIFGSAAVRGLCEGRRNVMVGLHPPKIDYVPLADVVQRMKNVPLDGEAVVTARALDICLGDALPRRARSGVTEMSQLPSR